MLEKQKGNSLVSGTAVYLASNILNAAIPFALLPVLTRFLTTQEYGEVAMFQTWIGALAAFVGLSLHGAAIVKFYDGNLGKNELKEFIGACLQILAVTTLVSFVAVFALSEHLSEWLGLSREWVILGVLVVACAMLSQIRLGQWQAKKQAVKYGTLQVSQSLLNILLSLAMVVVLLQGANGRISAQVYTAIIFAVVALWLLKRDDLLTLFKWRPEYIKEALKFGVPLIPHVGGMYLLLSVDRFVINSKLGLSQVGIYMVAVQFGTGIALIFDAVNKAYVPWLFECLKRDDENEKRKIVRLTYAWYFLILLGIGLAFIIGPWMVTFVAGDKYARAGQIFGWIALGQGFKGMYLMQTNYIFFSKRTGLLSAITLSTGLLSIALMLYLIPRYGLEGAAYSFSAAMVLYFFLTWAAAQRRHPMPWFSFIRAKN